MHKSRTVQATTNLKSVENVNPALVQHPILQKIVPQAQTTIQLILKIIIKAINECQYLS